MKGVFSDFISFFRNKAKGFPDKRVRSNAHYTIEDIALSAFSVFYMQSPSFFSISKKHARKKGEK